MDEETRRKDSDAGTDEAAEDVTQGAEPPEAGRAAKDHDGQPGKAPVPADDDAWPTKSVAALPLPPRSDEIRAGLALSIGGFLVFWGGWSLYDTSLAQKHVNYFSHSGWLFMIAFFLIVLASFYFVRWERTQAAPSDKKTRAGARQRLDRAGVVLTAFVLGPMYLVYWWKGWEIWREMYPTYKPIYFVLLVLASVGLIWGLRPPSMQEERARRMPTRRVILLLSVPFAVVYGMIWLASFYPDVAPWPGV